MIQLLQLQRAQLLLHNYDHKEEKFKNLDLVDQVKYSLGIRIRNSNEHRALFSKIIKSRTRLPCDGEETFCTAYDTQVKCCIKIVEGEEDYLTIILILMSLF